MGGHAHGDPAPAAVPAPVPVAAPIPGKSGKYMMNGTCLTMF